MKRTGTYKPSRNRKQLTQKKTTKSFALKQKTTRSEGSFVGQSKVNVRSLYPSLDTYSEMCSYPDIEWWRAIRAILGKNGAKAQHKLVTTAYKALNKHFKGTNLQEIAILCTFYRYPGQMDYGKNIHTQIAETVINKTICEQLKGFIDSGDEMQIVDPIHRRVAVASQRCLDLIKVGGIKKKNCDVLAVMPTIVFYSGFVINFGRAAGFNNTTPASNATRAT